MIEDLLKLIRLLLPQGAILPGSIYAVRTVLQKHLTKPKKLFVCQCERYFYNIDLVINDPESICPQCSARLSGTPAKWFYSFSLIEKLKHLYEFRPDWVEAILRPWKETGANDSMDVNHGEKWRQTPLLQTQGNLAFGMSADGVALKKSSVESVWPITITVLNLERSQR